LSLGGNIIAALIQQDNLARVDIISESGQRPHQEEGLGLFEARGHKRCVVVNTMAEFPSDPTERGAAEI
jgi:hypothetical protein